MSAPWPPSPAGSHYVTGDCEPDVYTPCIGRDPLCPCQDGDACHYRDTPTSKAWPVPERPEEADDYDVLRPTP